MQVSRTENTDVKALAQGGTEKPAKAATNIDKKDSLNVDATGYVARALALPTDGAASAAAIEEAKALIASGEIDSPEAIRAAAGKIVAGGI